MRRRHFCLHPRKERCPTLFVGGCSPDWSERVHNGAQRCTQYNTPSVHNLTRESFLKPRSSLIAQLGTAAGVESPEHTFPVVYSRVVGFRKASTHIISWHAPFRKPKKTLHSLVYFFSRLREGGTRTKERPIAASRTIQYVCVLVCREMVRQAKHAHVARRNFPSLLAKDQARMAVVRHVMRHTLLGKRWKIVMDQKIASLRRQVL